MYTRNNFEIERAEGSKDHFSMKINGVDMGVWEKSELRHFMGKIDEKVHH